jgi:hypothetical protein
MARSFKNLLGDDSVNTRTLLHEAIPITGTIASGTYTDNNIKTFTHGMFQSVYDYPYLSSSANHIFDLTYGHSSAQSSSVNTQNAKKMNIYNQMAQVLMGYDVSGNIRNFDSDGTLDADGVGTMHHCFFMNFSRLLSKDEVKKNSFRLALYNSGTVGTVGHLASTGRTNRTVLGDYNSANQFRTSPAGDYGLLFTGSTGTYPAASSVGLVFYQAGVVVLTSSFFSSGSAAGGLHGAPGTFPTTNVVEFGSGVALTNTGSIELAQANNTINELASGFRYRLEDVDFNNTIELNSSIYFCRVNHNEFNYSANPTYVDGSKIRVKNNVSDLPVSYITTVGLYSPDNELMAVAKLSEPIRKDPNTELTLRVRLDY